MENCGDDNYCYFDSSSGFCVPDNAVFVQATKDAYAVRTCPFLLLKLIIQEFANSIDDENAQDYVLVRGECGLSTEYECEGKREFQCFGFTLFVRRLCLRRIAL